MAGIYRFELDQKDIVRFLVTTVGSFTQDRLINKQQRTQHKDQCAERLAAQDGSGSDRDTDVRYSDQAVLANLDWGIDALEEAINTSNMETKLARLDYAEKMLQVCAMLNSNEKTAGVPNFYLSAWAHLNLSYLWKLRNNSDGSVLHILEMFIIDPFFSRVDFAPELWKTLFLPHMTSIVGWYSEARHRLVMEVVPDSADLSFTADLDQFFNDSLIFSVRPDQAEKLQKLEQLYGDALDENTRLYAKYYKDCMNFDATTSKKVIPMFPIAEPPMTPLREVSRSIPDFVKFGPILPKSAGFSPIIKAKDNAREAYRMNTTSVSTKDDEESAAWDPQDGQPGENEDENDDEPKSPYLDSVYKSHNALSLRSTRMNDEKESGSKHQMSKVKNRIYSPTNFSPLVSPRTPSPKPAMYSNQEAASVLRLSSSRVMDFTVPSSLHASPNLQNDSSVCSSDSDGELIERPRSFRTIYGPLRSMSDDNSNCQVSENSYLGESDEGSQSCISLPSSDKLTPRSRPPKDFVCPITSQIFNDPVTLETGQTYERKAIQEWLKRGNTTCPITRHPLIAITLPRTNYVLKRLITSWKEQHPDLAQEFSYSETPRNSFGTCSNELSLKSSLPKPLSVSNQKSVDGFINQKARRFSQAAVSTSPTSVISQAAIETVINGLKPHISCLCTSVDLQECEAAVLEIARIWKDAKVEAGIYSFLSDPTIVNGLIEILSASLNRNVLRTSIYILSELIFADERVGETLTSVDSDFDCLATLLQNGLAEAAVLMYQLRPGFSQLSTHDLIPSLIHIIVSKYEDSDDLKFLIEPKNAAIAMLEQILVGGDRNSRSVNAITVISANGLPALIKYLDRVEGRQSIIFVLLCCVHADKSCRNLIADKIELSHVLELFHTGNDSVRGICVEFLSELVKLNRRTLCNQLLQIIKDEGAFSTMHTFLVYLQIAPMEQQPLIAALLLQLDLLVEPRKMSIYREEAIEALIESLRRKEFPSSQLMALDAIVSLSGCITASGKSYTEEWLLKTAGFDEPYTVLMKAEGIKRRDNEMIETREEVKASSSWEKRVAFVLCNHEKGSIFKAIKDCFKSNSLEMAKTCLIVATWLVHMLYNLPDTNIRDAARKSLLDQFINVLQSSKNLEEKILATLALRSFVKDKDALEELGVYAKCIYSTLKKLKKNSVAVTDILKALMSLPSVNATDLWSCTEMAELDTSANGEILSMLYLKGRVFSSHSDGTIKVWDAGKKILRLIQEVREHTRAVTCLYIPPSGDKLYSGSLDKSIRVWAIKPEEIYCLQVHDVKEAVYELTANANYACFSSQGTGVKLYNWTGVPKHINFNKNVKCLAIAGDKLYCGCSGYNIQEVDLCKSASNTFYAGAKKLLGKQAIHSLYIHDGFLFAGGSSVDGSAGKVFSLASKAATGSFSTGLDVQNIAVNKDFIFTGTKCGMIEVWLKEGIKRVASIKTGGGGHTKVRSLISDLDGEMLFAGASDGKIQAWSLQ